MVENHLKEGEVMKNVAGMVIVAAVPSNKSIQAEFGPSLRGSGN